MSRYMNVELPCPECEGLVAFRAYQSINADRKAAFRDQVLDNTFQEQTCPHCETAFRMDPEIVYFDEALGLWIRALPLDQQAAWRKAEADTMKVHIQTFGPFAPDAVQEIAAKLQKRVTFGWAGLREKLLCAQAGIDDGSLEVLKVFLLASGFGDKLDDEAELRLADVTERGLEFVWLMGPMEVPIEGFAVPVAMLGEVEGPDWAEARASVSGDYYVDMNRALLDGEAEAATAAPEAARTAA